MIMLPQPMVPQKHPLDSSFQMPHKRATTDRVRVGREVQLGEIDSGSQIDKNVSVTRQLMAEPNSSFGFSNVQKDYFYGVQPPSRIVRPQIPNEAPPPYYIPVNIQQTHPFASLSYGETSGFPPMLQSDVFHHSKQDLGNDSPPYRNKALFSPHVIPMQMQQSRPIPRPSPSHTTNHQNFVAAHGKQRVHAHYNQSRPSHTPRATGARTTEKVSQRPAAEIEKPSWHWDDVTDRTRHLAMQYLDRITPQLELDEPTTIPGIPRHYHFNFDTCPWRFAPEEIWLLRHLQIPARHMEYLTFIQLGKQMLDPTNDKVYWNAWYELRYRTVKLSTAERDFLSDFAAQPGETEEQMQTRLANWTGVISIYSVETRIDQTGSHYSQQPVRSNKRSLDDEAFPVQLPSAKKSRRDNSTTTQNGIFPQKRFETRMRDQMKAHKKGKRVTEPNPLYKAEHLELGVGAASKYDWESYHDEKETEIQRKEANSKGSNNGGLTDEENLSLPYWLRSYSNDTVRLPDHPFENIEDYTIQANGRYKCFHKDFDCVSGTCTPKNHDCCRVGYDNKGLKRAMDKAKKTYKSQVERGIKDGKLDPRHKCWTATFNQAIKKQRVKKGSKKAAEASRNDTARSGAAAQSSDHMALSGLTAQDVAMEHEKQKRWQADQDKKLEQQRTVKLRKFAEARESAHRIYVQLPHHIGMPYFNAWWDAYRSKFLGEPPTEEEKEWHERPNPLYAEAKHLPPLAGISEDIQGTDQSVAVAESVPTVSGVSGSNMSADQNLTLIGAFEVERTTFDDLFYSDDDEDL